MTLLANIAVFQFSRHLSFSENFFLGRLVQPLLAERAYRAQVTPLSCATEKGAHR